jgi:hypothetical protein
MTRVIARFEFEIRAFAGAASDEFDQAALKKWRISAIPEEMQICTNRGKLDA